MTIFNIANTTLNMNVSIENFVNEFNESLNIGFLNETSIMILSNKNKTINLKINTSNIEGLILGKLIIKTNQSENQKIVPISFSKYSTVNLELIDDVYSTDLSRANAFIMRTDKGSVTGMTQIDTLKYSAQTIPGNLTILVYGYDNVNYYYYYLLTDVDLLSGETKTVTLNMSQSREYTVKAKSFEGETLDLYQFMVVMMFYNNLNENLGSFSYSSYGTGDQKIRITGKDKIKNMDNVDVIVKFEGIVN